MDSTAAPTNDTYVTSSGTSMFSGALAHSTPLVPVVRSTSVSIQKQVSAPSYLFSFKENEAPPFQIPVKEPRHKLLVGTERLMTEQEAVEMIAASTEEGGIRKYLGKFLVEKKIIHNFNISEREFLIILIIEVIDYGAQRDFSAFKLACMMTIYLSSHMYFKWSYWQPPLNLWNYFKGLMIRHTTEDSPDGQLIFSPEDSYDIVTHFHTAYVTNLPLIHIATFGSHRLKFNWPFNAKK